MSNRFAGKVALVTGGGSGIGRAVALALAAEGATVAVAGRSHEALAETVKLIEVNDGTATAITADVTDAADVERMVAPWPRWPTSTTTSGRGSSRPT